MKVGFLSDCPPLPFPLTASGEATGVSPDVLPVRVDHHTRLGVSPRQEVVVTSIKHGVGRLSGRGAWRYRLVQLVAVVTNADLKLDWGIHRTDHCGIEEGSMHFILSPSLEFL